MDRYVGKVRITRRSGGGGDRICIQLDDGPSHCRAIEIEIAPEVFTDALTSRDAPCEYEINTSGVLGATAEHKSELVPFDFIQDKTPYARREAMNDYRTPDAVEALRPFEVDGWRADARGLFNGHNTVQGHGVVMQKVAFYRYIKDGKPLNGGDA